MLAIVRVARDEPREHETISLHYLCTDLSTGVLQQFGFSYCPQAVDLLWNVLGYHNIILS